MSDVAQETFGSDARCFAMLLHLTLLIERFNDGPFKDGFQTAIEEAAAYLDHLHEDGGDQAQTLMEQMCGLVNGHYALKEITGPIGVVVDPPPPLTDHEAQGR